jgi:hypothetical protein
MAFVRQHNARVDRERQLHEPGIPAPAECFGQERQGDALETSRGIHKHRNELMQLIQNGGTTGDAAVLLTIKHLGPPGKR